MKKIKFGLLFAFCCVLFLPQYGSTQNDFSMVMNGSVDMSYDYEDVPSFFNDRKSESTTSESVVVDAKKLEADFDAQVVDGFGAYFNPISHSFKFKAANVSGDYKVQLTNTETGEKINTSNISYYGNIVDLSSLDSGNYMLIITDDKNNIHSEKISVLKYEKK